jgi:membrane-associated protease RseP (regulator of RpoE activity)
MGGWQPNSMYNPIPWPVTAQPETNVPNLQRLLWDVFVVADTQVVDPPDKVVEFRGQLTQASDQAYAVLNPRFHDAGYTLVLYRDRNQDVVQALRGVTQARPTQLWINALLLLATILTTLMAGAAINGANVPSLGAYLQQPALLLEGIPFAFTLLLILGVHEMGHYVAGRVHHAAVTLPYFIPVPPFGALPLGTLGAFIQLRSPITNRRALFDIGVAGPLAGLVVAIAAFGYGLMIAEPVRASGAGISLGRSIFTQFLIGVIQPRAALPGYAAQLNPIMLAGWLGLFVTVLNLLPIGQLDGGHILYAAIGRRAALIGMVTVGMLVTMGYAFGATTWLLWGFLGLIFGVRHAPTLDDITPLDPARRVIALATMILFVLIFVPVPFR